MIKIILFIVLNVELEMLTLFYFFFLFYLVLAFIYLYHIYFSTLGVWDPKITNPKLGDCPQLWPVLPTVLNRVCPSVHLSVQRFFWNWIISFFLNFDMVLQTE